MKTTQTAGRHPTSWDPNDPAHAPCISSANFARRLGKPQTVTGIRFVELAEAADFIPDGATLGVGRLPPMSLVRQLIRRGTRNLDLVSAPTGGLAEDVLVAAGAVRSIHTSGIDLAEHGLAPNFSRAAEAGSIPGGD